MKEQITSSIKLLCLDIDGTLLDTSHQLPPENRAAVQYAAKQGVTVCLLSARPPQAIFPIQQALGVPGPVASFGGALIQDGETRIFDRRLPTDDARTVIGLAQQHGISLSFYRDTAWLVEQEDEWSRAEGEITGLHPDVTPLVAALADGAPHKLLCMGAADRIDGFCQLLQQQGLDAALLRSKDEYLEILPQKADKADALRTLCRYRQLAPEQTMAMGDHDVDCTMLRAAGIGVAMGNSSDAARQAADWMAPDNDHAGVAAAIHHWIGEETE
ncbi:MAG: Cof-type HAD-IIB family hydrolase [Butyricicoccus sp.]|nr:Cof-type HAD-IIB family hydrolase [Butyricicoccus sp.]